MSTANTGKHRKYPSVSRARPCPICGADSWCAFLDNGVKCMRCTDGANHVGTDTRGQEYGLYFNDSGSGRTRRPPREPDPPPAPIASEEARAAVYLAMVYALTLSAAHRDQLLRRGLTAEEIDLREYRTLTTHPGERAHVLDKAREAAASVGADLDTVPGFYRGGIVGAPGLLIPVRDAGASILAFKVRRDVGPKDDGPKYVWFSSYSDSQGREDGPSPGAITHVPLVSLRSMSTLPAEDRGVLRVTEGPLKADIATAITGVRTIGIPGASNIKDVVPVARALNPRAVRLAWDSDAAVAPKQPDPATQGPAAGRSIRRRNHVALSLERCAHALARELPDVGLEVETWEPEQRESAGGEASGENGGEISTARGAKGIDDALVARVDIAVHRGERAWVELHRVVTVGGEEPGLATCDRAGLAHAESSPAAPTPSTPTGPGTADTRTTIVVESRSVDRGGGAYTKRTPVTDLARAGLNALAATDWGAAVFFLENSNPPCMVHVMSEVEDGAHGHVARAQVVATTRNVLKGWFSGAARWMFEGGGRKGTEVVEADPPDTVVAFARESCEGVRPLRGIVEAPVMRRDGTIIATPGYDTATRLYAAFDAAAATRALDAIPAHPSQADAHAALDTLHRLVCDFPFEKPAHRATWVAGLLTMLAREMFDGPAPLFLARANTRGSGKTLLTELPHIIACGDRPAMLGWSGDEVEFEKQVTTEAIAGSACIVIDNITGTLRSATLDRILTSGKHRARILGGNQKFDGPMRAVWWASGNNLDTSDDMASRRIAPIELIATDARPEDRVGFSADASDGADGETGTAALRAHARRNRWSLVGAAMTILRAWHCAGRPVPADLPAWGSFESWSRVVRGALLFAGDVDPGEAHMEFRDASSGDTGQLRGLLEGWIDATDTRLLSPEGEPLNRVVKKLVAEAQRAARENDTARGAALRESLEAISEESIERWNAKTATRSGKWIRLQRRKVATTRRGDLAIDIAGETGGSARWRIVMASPSSGQSIGGAHVPAAPGTQTDHVVGVSAQGDDASSRSASGIASEGAGGQRGDVSHSQEPHAREGVYAGARTCVCDEEQLHTEQDGSGHFRVGDQPPFCPLPPLGMGSEQPGEALQGSYSRQNAPTGHGIVRCGPVSANVPSQHTAPASFDDDLPGVEYPFGDDPEGAASATGANVVRGGNGRNGHNGGGSW